MHIGQRFRNSWLSMPIDRKVRLLGGIFPAAIALIAIVYLFSVNMGYADIGRSFSDISRSLAAEEAMRDERSALATYMRNPSGNNRQLLDDAMVHTKSCIALLPDHFSDIGEERFARTRNIRNAYAVYEEKRDAARARNQESEGAVRELYQVYSDADYIETYLQDLTELTMEQGSRMYESRADVVQSMPILMLLLALVLVVATAHIWNWFSRFLVDPVQKLVTAVRRIGDGDFSGEDVQVVNKDELGELTDAVNTMKHGMEENIHTLRENQKLTERLYEEETTRLQTEKALESAKLDLLQARINPHFLFNTLNVINGMAELEGAETTGKMIRSLSSIFRYNLHTTTQMVTLSQELQVIRDYMYLQKMRFGARLTYTEDDGSVNLESVMIPVFLLQPIVENAVAHGTSKKVEGGTVTLSVREVREENRRSSRQQAAGGGLGEKSPDGRLIGEDQQNSAQNKNFSYLIITVSDTGVGMSREALEKLQRSLKSSDETAGGQAADGTGHTGIGLRNVYERVHRIYPDGEMTVDAEEGKGMTVQLILPQGES